MQKHSSEYLAAEQIQHFSNINAVYMAERKNYKIEYVIHPVQKDMVTKIIVRKKIKVFFMERYRTIYSFSGWNIYSVDDGRYRKILDIEEIKKMTENLVLECILRHNGISFSYIYGTQQTD